MSFLRGALGSLGDYDLDDLTTAEGMSAAEIVAQMKRDNDAREAAYGGYFSAPEASTAPAVDAAAAASTTIRGTPTTDDGFAFSSLLGELTKVGGAAAGAFAPELVKLLPERGRAPVAQLVQRFLPMPTPAAIPSGVPAPAPAAPWYASPWVLGGATLLAGAFLIGRTR